MVLNHDVENMNDMCIPVWVAVLFFVGQNNDIGLGERIYCVLLMS